MCVSVRLLAGGIREAFAFAWTSARVGDLHVSGAKSLATNLARTLIERASERTRLQRHSYVTLTGTHKHTDSYLLLAQQRHPNELQQVENEQERGLHNISHLLLCAPNLANLHKLTRPRPKSTHVKGFNQNACISLVVFGGDE